MPKKSEEVGSQIMDRISELTQMASYTVKMAINEMVRKLTERVDHLGLSLNSLIQSYENQSKYLETQISNQSMTDDDSSEARSKCRRDVEERISTIENSLLLMLDSIRKVTEQHGTIISDYSVPAASLTI
jgi:hypothetical protein